MLSPSALATERSRALDAVGSALGVGIWPALPVRWNRRLRRAGRAVIESREGHFVRAVIELSPAYFEVYPADLPGILVHEAVHVGLAVLGRPFGHGPDFREACAAAGGLLHSRWMPGRVFRYLCPACGAVHERRRRAPAARWCGRCVAESERVGGEPYAPARALRLVGVTFRGPEAAGGRNLPVCDPAPGGQPAKVPSGTPSRYPGVPAPSGLVTPAHREER